MAQDGVDISNFVPKTINEVIPLLLDNFHRYQHGQTSDWEGQREKTTGEKKVGTDIRITNNGIASLEDGHHAKTIKNNILTGPYLHNMDSFSSEVPKKVQAVDILIVLCSCPDTLKWQLADMSKEILAWDIDAPTSAAKAGERDSAYLCVSREIRQKAEDFKDKLKRCDAGY